MFHVKVRIPGVTGTTWVAQIEEGEHAGGATKIAERLIYSDGIGATEHPGGKGVELRISPETAVVLTCEIA